MNEEYAVEADQIRAELADLQEQQLALHAQLECIRAEIVAAEAMEAELQDALVAIEGRAA